MRALTLTFFSAKHPTPSTKTSCPANLPRTTWRASHAKRPRWGRKVAETERDLLLPVLAADTTVALNGKIYGKPADEKEAFEFLKDFSVKHTKF